MQQKWIGRYDRGMKLSSYLMASKTAYSILHLTQ